MGPPCRDSPATLLVSEALLSHSVSFLTLKQNQVDDIAKFSSQLRMHPTPLDHICSHFCFLYPFRSRKVLFLSQVGSCLRTLFQGRFGPSLMALISSRTSLGCTLALANILFLSMNSAFSISFCSTFSL